MSISKDHSSSSQNILHPADICLPQNLNSIPTYWTLPVCIEINRISYKILFEVGPRYYTHQCSNFVSSTIAQMGPSLSETKRVTIAQHLPLQIDYFPQLEIKINRLIHSHFISLMIFYKSSRKGFCSVLDEKTSMQIGKGLGEGRQGLHSNLLPSTDIKLTSQKDYKHELTNAYLQYLRAHIAKIKSICEKYARNNYAPSKKTLLADIEYLGLTPFKKDVFSIGIHLQENYQPKQHEPLYRRDLKVIEQFNNAKEILAELRALTQSDAPLQVTQKGHPFRKRCKEILPLLNAIEKDYHLLRPIVTCRQLKDLKSSHYYAENNRVDDMPQSLNDWDGHFLEDELRGFVRGQLREVAEGASPEVLAQQFIRRFEAFLKETREVMQRDLESYEHAKHVFQTMKIRERNLMEFFRSGALVNRHVEAFFYIENFFQTFSEFDNLIQELDQSKITPLRSIAQQIKKVYDSSYKRNLIGLLKDLLELSSKATEENIKEKLLQDKEFDLDAWQFNVNKIQKGQKTPWSSLVSNIQNSLQTQKFVPFDVYQKVTSILNGDGDRESITQLPTFLHTLEPDWVIPYQQRAEIQQLSWILLSDHIEYIMTLDRGDRTETENILLDLLDVYHLHLHINNDKLLEGPYLLSVSTMTNMTRSTEAFNECIDNIAELQSNTLEPAAKKVTASEYVSTLLLQLNLHPYFDYSTDHKDIANLLAKIVFAPEHKVLNTLESTLQKLKEILQKKQNTEYKCVANVLRRINFLLKKPFSPKKEKSPYNTDTIARFIPKRDALIKFKSTYQGNNEKISEGVLTGSIFLEAAQIEKQFPGSFHPIPHREINNITHDSLPPSFGRQLKGLIQRKDFSGLETFFHEHKLTDHEFATKILACKQNKENLDKEIQYLNSLQEPKGYEEVLMEEFRSRFKTCIDENEREHLELWTKNLRDYYSFDQESFEIYSILYTRFELANRLIAIMKELLHDPDLSEQELNFFDGLTNKNNVQNIMNGIFFKTALTMFTKRLEFGYHSRTLPETFEGMPTLWNRMCRFLKVGDKQKAEIHIHESVKQSINIRKPSLTTVEKDSCLVVDPFEEFSDYISEFQEIKDQVIPCYEKIVCALESEDDYEELLKKLVINELDLKDLYGTSGHKSEARRSLACLPLDVLSCLLTPTVANRTNRYKYIQVNDSQKVCKLLSVSPAGRIKKKNLSVDQALQNSSLTPLLPKDIVSANSVTVIYLQNDN